MQNLSNLLCLARCGFRVHLEEDGHFYSIMSMYGRLAELNNCHFQIIQAFKKTTLHIELNLPCCSRTMLRNRLPVMLLGMTYPGPETCNDDPL